MPTKKAKTYSYNEYLDAFYPSRIQEDECETRLFGETFEQRSLETLKKSFERPRHRQKRSSPGSKLIKG